MLHHDSMDLRPFSDSYILQECMKAAGYKIDEKGMCFGISHMALQAILCQEIDEFDQRVRDIVAIGVDNFIQDAQYRNIDLDKIPGTAKKIISQIRKGDLYKKISEIIPFFDGIEIFQQLYKHPYLTEKNNHTMSQDAMLSIPLTANLALNDELVKIGNFSGAYSAETLNVYLNTCIHRFRNAIEEDKYPISLVFGSSNHSITLGFHPKKSMWYLSDPAHSPISQRFTDTADVAKKIISALSNDETAIFSTTLYLTKKNQESWLKTDVPLKTEMAITPNLSLHKKNTLLYIAAKNGHSDIVNTILSQGADPNSPEINDYPPLFIAAQNNHADVIETLITCGADSNKPDKNGDTPLFFAIQNNKISAVEALIKNGANTNHVNANGFTPLFFAVKHNQLAAMEILLKNKANPNHTVENETTALHFATEIGDSRMVDLLLVNGANPNQSNIQKHSPLFIAVQKKYIDIMEALIAKGAKPNQVDANGHSPLFFASHQGDTHVIELLLSKGANPNQVDKNGYTPLCLAVQAGHSQVVNVLLNNGADPNLGRITPLQMAVNEKKITIACLILNSKKQITTPFTCGTSFLSEIAKKIHPAAGVRLNEWIATLLPPRNVTIKPKIIEDIMKRHTMRENSDIEQKQELSQRYLPAEKMLDGKENHDDQKMKLKK